MRSLFLALLLVPALALASEPTQSVTVVLPVPVVEALSSVVASRHLAGDTQCTLQSLIRDILTAQAEQIAQQAVAAEQTRRKATEMPALRAWKRRVAKLADDAENAQAQP